MWPVRQFLHIPLHACSDYRGSSIHVSSIDFGVVAISLCLIWVRCIFLYSVVLPVSFPFSRSKEYVYEVCNANLQQDAQDTVDAPTMELFFDIGESGGSAGSAEPPQAPRALITNMGATSSQGSAQKFKHGWGAAYLLGISGRLGYHPVPARRLLSNKPSSRRASAKPVTTNLRSVSVCFRSLGIFFQLDAFIVFNLTRVMYTYYTSLTSSSKQ